MKALSILMTVLALTCPARGQDSVAYSSFTFTGPGDWQPWDVNQDGVVDFTLRQSWIITQDVPTSFMAYDYGIRPTAESYVLGAGSYAAVLSDGDVITSSPAGAEEWRQPLYGGSLLVGMWSANLLEGTWSGWKGPMENVDEAFLGLRFTASDGEHFGWLRVKRGGNTTLATIVPIDFAWETHTGESISAGVVPEPSTVALSILAAVWFAVLRRLRLYT